MSHNKAAEQQSQQQANQQAEANQNQQTPTPEQAAAAEAGTTEKSMSQKIADVVDAIVKVNPDMPIDQVMAIATKAVSPKTVVQDMIDKEAARIIPTVSSLPDMGKMIYFKKDTGRKFPFTEAALDGVVARQTYKKKTEEGDEIVVPARNLNEVAVYSEHDFEVLSQPGKGFEREGITVEIWHKPGDKNTVQAEKDSDSANADE